MTPTRYASSTEVPVDRSKAEIERLLRRHGARRFASGWDHESAYVMFEMGGRRIRLTLPLPDRQADEFVLTPAKRFARAETDAQKAWEQACRARWRALRLVIQAKLEATEIGISTLEEEFLAWTLLPNGQTVADVAIPAVEKAYLTGEMPPMLPAGVGIE